MYVLGAVNGFTPAAAEVTIMLATSFMNNHFKTTGLAQQRPITSKALAERTL